MSDAGGFDPLVDVAASPASMPIAQTDVVRSRGVNSPLPLGRPVVQCRDRHAGHVVNLFGREHLTARLLRNRHVDSQLCWRDRRLSVVHCPSGRAVTVSSYPHGPVHNFWLALACSDTRRAQLPSMDFGSRSVSPRISVQKCFSMKLVGPIGPIGPGQGAPKPSADFPISATSANQRHHVSTLHPSAITCGYLPPNHLYPLPLRISVPHRPTTKKRSAHLHRGARMVVAQHVRGYPAQSKVARC